MACSVMSHIEPLKVNPLRSMKKECLWCILTMLHYIKYIQTNTYRLVTYKKFSIHYRVHSIHLSFTWPHKRIPLQYFPRRIIDEILFLLVVCVF